jgi:hypothetical protein
MALPDGPFHPGQRPPEPNRGEPRIFLPPNVTLHIFFTYHGSKELFGDTAHFTNLIKNADIVVPENSVWSNEILKMQNDISRGNERIWRSAKEGVIKEANPFFVDFFHIYYDALYGSHAKVTYVDIQDESRGQEKLEEKLKTVVNFNLTVDQNLASIQNLLKEIAERQQNREDHMIKNLGPRLTQVIEPNPKLSKKKRVSALMIIGSSHTRIFEILSNHIQPDSSGLPSISHEINRTAKVELPHIDLENSYKTGGQEIKEQDRQRLAIEVLAYNLIESVFGNKVNEIILPSILKQLSKDELLELFYSAQISYRKQVVLYSVSPLWKKIYDLIDNFNQK